MIFPPVGTGGTTVTSRLLGERPKMAELFHGKFPHGAEIGQKLDEFLARLVGVTSGLPRPHQETHLQGGVDGFPAPGTPATIDPNVAGSAGSGPQYALHDHGHSIDLKLSQEGDLLTHDGSEYVALSQGVAPDGAVLVKDSAAQGGMRWRVLDPFTVPLGAPMGENYSDFLMRMSIEGYQNRNRNAQDYS